MSRKKGGVNAALLVKPKYIHLWNIVKPAERKGRTNCYATSQDIGPFDTPPLIEVRINKLIRWMFLVCSISYRSGLISTRSKHASPIYPPSRKKKSQ